MKSTFLITFTVLTINLLQAQNILKPKWKFKTGDDISWARIEHDDSDWKEINAGIIWEKQGFDNYDGFAWYRMSLTIPSSLKKETEKMGGLQLNLSKVDDSDYFYFNGEFIAKSGELPPNYLAAYDVNREYSIPVEKILWDKANVIAIRVFDGGGGGGIVGDAIELKVKGAVDNISIGAIFERPDRIYLNKKEINIPVTVSSVNIPAIKGKMSLSVRTDFGDSTYMNSMPLELSKNGTKQLLFNLKSLKPGFYNAVASLESPTSNKSFKFSFGVDPEKIVSPTDQLPDFENYWERAKTELAAVTPQFKMELIDSMSQGSRNVYLLSMRSLGNILVKAWYAVPKKKGRYPAILQVQGYSSFRMLELTPQNEDFVILALNVRGHGFSKDHVNPGFPGYLQYFVNDKEQYIYRGAYMDTRRAVDFLSSRPEVDPTKIIVEGGSQGGALSIATAALNNDRIALCLPHVPFLSDFKDYFKTATWPGNEFKNYVAEHPEVGWEKVYETLSYIDIKNLAPWVKCPTLMAVGLVDDICPPHINFAAYNQLKVKREYIVYPTNGHGLPSEYHVYKYQWIKNQLGMK